MRINEVREMSDEDLLKKIISSKEELFHLRFKASTGQLDNPSLLKKSKKTMARMHTILRERELGISPAKPAAGAAAQSHHDEEKPKTKAKKKSPTKVHAKVHAKKAAKAARATHVAAKKKTVTKKTTKAKKKK